MYLTNSYYSVYDVMFQVAAFVNDGSPDVRYYGRYIINELMVHDEFMKCVDRCLSPDNAQLVKTAANNIRQRVSLCLFVRSFVPAGVLRD